MGRRCRKRLPLRCSAAAVFALLSSSKWASYHNQERNFEGASELQKELYQHIIYNLTEYQLLRTSNKPCDCGVNRNFFLKYRKLPTKAAKIEFTRQHKEKIILRKQCCYIVPEGDDVVLWPAQHEDDKACKKCPSCISLPAFQKLNILAIF